MRGGGVRWMGCHHALKIEPTDRTLLLKYFLLQCMMQYYCKSSVESPTTGFWQLTSSTLCEDVYSQLWVHQAVGTNHSKCSSIFTIWGNITGVIYRLVTTKDKERYPNPLTKQNAQGLGSYVGLSLLKTRKEIHAPLQRDTRKKT